MTMQFSGSSGLTFPDTSTQSSGKQVCKAWVNFNGTGTPAIRDSFNVSSITDNGTGDYTVNFTNAMPNANYAAAFMIQNSATVRFETAVIRGDVNPATSSLRFVTGISDYGVANYQLDVPIVCVSIFSA